MNLRIHFLNKIIGEIADESVILFECDTGIGFHVFLEIAKKHDDLTIFAHKRLKRVFGKKIIYPNDEYNLQQLYTIPLAIKKCKSKIVMFTILHDLFSIHSTDSVCNLFTEVANIVRDCKKIMLSSIDTKLISERALSMLENESDYVIEIREFMDGLKIKRGIRVKKSLTKPPSDFYSLDLEKLEIGDKLI